MWSRFQIGSKRPLAKRSARMFWTASLPRKWSIRKICDSSKAPCSVAFSSTADSVVVPNGFSRMTRAAGPFRPTSWSVPMIDSNAAGGTAR